MKGMHARLLALCIGTSLLAGCGANGTESAAGTQVETQAPDGISEAAQTETGQTEAVQPETADAGADSLEPAGIFVEPVEGISDNFIRGMDASSVLAEEKSGVKYYNFDGEEQDVFQTLAEGGVNYIRLRVWNDPYDADGNGYGGKMMFRLRLRLGSARRSMA